MQQRKDGWASKVLGCFGFIVFIYVAGFIAHEVIPSVTRWVASGVHSLPILGDLTVFIGRVLRGGLVLGLAFVLGAVSWLSGRALWRMTVGDEDFHRHGADPGRDGDGSREGASIIDDAQGKSDTDAGACRTESPACRHAHDADQVRWYAGSADDPRPYAAGNAGGWDGTVRNSVAR